ncbi:hypothetical protein ACQ4PT_005840 [Festuca glaucescens]
MAAPPSWKEDLADDEGTSLSRSSGFAHTSPTPPFLGHDPTTVGVSRAGAPGSAVSWGGPGLGYGDLTAVARPGRSPVAMLGPPPIDDPVEVRGDGAPAPAKDFRDSGLAAAVLQNLARCGFEIPTPLQSYSIPIVLAGRDLMACAPTGSGKTAAFCIPVLSGLAAMSAAGRVWTGEAGRVRNLRLARPRALLLVPTMERAKQINEESRKFTFQTGLRLGLLYEGSPIFEQLLDLEEGVDVVVATPSRLLDTVKRSRISLDEIKYVVIDEADRMVDMGFEPIMRKILNDMDMPNKAMKRTMIFSETFTEEVQNLASDFLENYIVITVRRVETRSHLVRQKVDFITDGEKISHLLSLLQGQYVTVTGKLYQPLTLVFVETKRNAVFLRHLLGHKGFLSAVIHGETTLQEKVKTLESFRDGLTPILVTTDAGSRGLDFPNVAHVINYDFPESIEDYAYRIGRAGKVAFATAFFTESNHYLAKGLLELMTEAKQDVPDWLEKYALDPRVKVDIGRLHEKDELSHWMSQLLIEEEEEQQQEEEEATLMDDKYEECLTGVEGGFQTLSCPR